MANFETNTEQTVKGKIVPYYIDAVTKIDVREFDNDFWQTIEQIAKMYGVDRRTIEYHIKEIYKDKDLQEERTCQKFWQVRDEGGRTVSRLVTHYNIDMIIQIGFRVKSDKGFIFREWTRNLVKNEFNKEVEKRYIGQSKKQDKRTSVTAQKYPAKQIERVDLIKDLLVKKGITQKQVAKELGVHYVTVHNAIYGINYSLAVENWLKENLFNDISKKSAYTEKILEKWEEARNGSIEANDTLTQMLSGFRALHSA